MRMPAVVVSILLAAVVGAEKPWETRLDLPVEVPVELPAIAPLNPFATAVESAPVVVSMPLRQKFTGTFPVQVAAYIDSNGVCQKLVLVRSPWGGLGAELQTAFTETTFTPGRSFGGPVATWLPAAVDLHGRIEEGRVLTIQVSLPDAATPPEVEPFQAPVAEKRDLALPAVPVERLDQLPTPKRFRARVNERTWREKVRVLVEVGLAGKVERVVFLSCPEGLQGWLLASFSGWSFKPAQGRGGAVKAWVVVDATLEVVANDLAADALRMGRQTVYPLPDGSPAPAQAPSV